MNLSDLLKKNTKATGAEVDTGTDDAKYVTSKAIADSKLSYTDGTETLTNKTFDDEFRGKQIATPSNPSSGYNKLYFKSDNKLYSLTSAGTETEVGAGGGGGITFSAISSNTNAVADNGYIVGGSSFIEITLPTTCAVGKQIEIVGANSLGWIVKQNASQKIQFGNVSSTTGTGGQINSTQSKDCVRLVCTTANTTFQVISSVGNINLI